jgi:hypothetical protein
MTQYEHALTAMERLLTAVGEEHWANWIREDLDRWKATSDVVHHLSAYGGMGSFNDVIISVRNQHRVTNVHEPWVNTLFEWLKAICYYFAHHSHDQVTTETLRTTVGRDVPSLAAFVGGDRAPASMRGYATSDHDLSGWRCLACGREEVSSRNIDYFIAEDVLPSMVFRACVELTLNDLVDKTLAIDIQGLAESRRQLVATAEASGIIVRDREGWMRDCPACGRGDTAVYRWRLVRDAMKLQPSSDNSPMRNERWWHRLLSALRLRS